MSREQLIELHQDEIGTDTSDGFPAGHTAVFDMIRDEINTGNIDGIEAWRDAVRDNATDAEVYQWFRVSGWLAQKLKQIGECVLDNEFGEWWGRQCCGQSIEMDGTLQKVAAMCI
jgi:hypothetical protein